jgi:hypothetical protein
LRHRARWRQTSQDHQENGDNPDATHDQLPRLLVRKDRIR